MPSHEKPGNVVVILGAQSEAFHDRPGSSTCHLRSAQPIALIYSDKLAQQAALGKARECDRSVAAQLLATESETESCNTGTAFNCLI
jgi:hypothetical protein